MAMIGSKIAERLENFWSNKFNPLQFYLGFLIYELILYWLHEFFHLMPATLLGGEAVAKPIFGLLPVFATEVTVWPPETWKQLVIVFSGGLVTSAICVFLWSQTIDLENKIIFHAIGWAQFAEGLLEGVAWSFDVYEEPWVNWVRFGAILLATIIALVRSKKMWETRALGGERSS